MLSLNRGNRFNFWFVAVLTIATAAFVIAVSLPAIQSLQYKGVDTLLRAARQDNSQALALTQQAAVIGWNDPVATEKLAEVYKQRGESTKALLTYVNASVATNPIYTGYLALQYGDVGIAQSMFRSAQKDGEDAQAQAGMAISSFALGQIDDGCKQAERAVKLDLSDQRGQVAQQICDVLQNQSKRGERAQAYLLVNNYLYKQGEAKLQTIQDKTAADYLMLARMKANRGELNKAIELVQQGLDLDPSNPELLQTIITYLQRNSRTGESEHYQSQLNDVLFVKSQ